ncbi:MAG: hypothetical protein K0A93_03980 [Desulfuromonadaceae bacterium]|nr:hypothetical protein [Desulfuromonadaceae bacterium]MDF1579638.1 hypothetical protein [Desulfuromonadales bacterium]MDT8424010.1 hypothetical protein [Desulfuromonadales bacterium]
MIELHPQYLIDEKNQRQAVVLPCDEWEHILEALEELDDVKAFDRAKSGAGEALPFEQAVREIEQDYKA